MMDFKTAAEMRYNIKPVEAFQEPMVYTKEIQKPSCGVLIESLPFPSFKYEHFMRRLSRMIRVHASNGAQDKLFELSNMIDSRIQ